MNRLIDFSSRFRILKGGKISLVVSAFLGGTIIANAAPSGGVVTSGNATINQSGNVTNINQSSQKASINWNDFSIKSNETVNFNQPNVNSITLNRVVGTEKSVINGALNANGQVWILNSNGVLFNKNAKVNTSGLVATTAQLSDADFQAGNYEFKNSSSNSVINVGTIEVQNGGSVVLASNEVQNSGTIKAVRGKVHLVGADSYSLNLNGNSLVNLTVNKGVLDALVKNSGNIIANGGEIYLTTNAVNELLKGVVNNTGIIEANSIDGITGKVEMFAHGGTAEVSGTINAEGGFVETSGKDFKVESTTKVKAKTWLIDPTNITVSDATAYETSLNAGTNTLIQTTNATGSDEGNIYINDTIDWTTTAKLTLDAYNNIYINKAITATSGGKLAFYYGDSGDYYVNAKVNLSAGDNFFTKQTSDGVETTWKVITSLGSCTMIGGCDSTGLLEMGTNLSGNYVLGADINASATSSWNIGDHDGDTGEFTAQVPMGWIPIGNLTTKFTGNFDGLGHTVDALTINRPTENYIGLFGYTDRATIKNIGVTNVNITGNRFVGGLVGANDNFSTVINSYSSGSVTGGPFNAPVGGLVGANDNSSTVSNSYFSGSVTSGADAAVGGLVGRNWYSSTISNSYSTGNVSGGSESNIGGLVGANDSSSSVSNAYYDNEANTGAMADSATYGKTKAQIVAALSPLDEWTAGGADIEGYATTILTLPELVAFYTSNGEILFAGGFGTEANPYTITNWTQLQNINNSNILTQNYYFSLLNDLSSATSDYTDLASSTANSGLGWKSIGYRTSYFDTTHGFIGNFDGLGHTIDGLYINRPTDSIANDSIGLFGYIYNSTLSNIGVTNANVTGYSNVGALAGYIDNFSTIQNSYSSGSVTSTYTYTGGLVGFTWYSTIDNSYSSANVIGRSKVGGLVGGNYGDSIVRDSYATGIVMATTDIAGGLVGDNSGDWHGSKIINSYATGDVSGNNSVGGLVGRMEYYSSVENSYSSGNVSGTTNVGGLAGYAEYSILFENSYATGNVTGTGDNVGGLVGYNYLDSIVRNSYATGDVSGANYIGGLVGDNKRNSLIENSYSIGSVSGTGDYTGGLVGANIDYSAVTNSYYDKTLVTGMSDESSYGKTTEELRNLAQTNWSDTIWTFIAGGADVAGFELYERPILKGVTADADKPDTFTLFAGGFGTSDDAYTITNWTQLQNINNSNILTQNYYFSLLNDLMSSTQGYTTHVKDGETLANGGTGWNPIGRSGGFAFRGNFDGLGHTISDLYIYRPTSDFANNNMGLFGFIDGGSILSNIGVTNANVTGNGNVGALVGYMQGNSTIQNSYSSGSVSGNNYDIGGLVGYIWNGSVVDSYSTANVSGYSEVGGLLGGASGSSSVTNSYATGDVIGTGNYIGGLVGMSEAPTTITRSYATGDVTGINYVGGLAGSSGNSIRDSYATGDVTGTSNVGGLLGRNQYSAIYNAYSTGKVTGTGDNVRGLIGENLNPETIVAYYDKTVNTGMADESSYGKTTKELQTLATFGNAGWSIELDETQKKIYPYLTFDENGGAIWKVGKYATALNYILGTQNTTYNGTNQSLNDFWTNTVFGNGGSELIAGTDYKFVYNTSDTTSFKNAGTYNNISIVLLNEDYELDETGTNTLGKFVIAKKDATITAASDTKTYNGLTQTVSGFTASGLVNDETESVLTGISGASVSGKNAGEYTTTLIGSDGNYNLTFVDGKLTITPKQITVVANNLSKIFGDNDPILTYIAQGIIENDTLDGLIQRASGENTGEYTISKGTLANPNYSITFNNGVFTIKRDTTLDSAINSIANTTAVQIPKVEIIVPKIVVAPQAQPIVIASTGNQVNVMSQPIQNQNTTMVTMGELRANQDTNTSNGNSDIRVPVGDNSVIELINGGVNLPLGVEQQFFVVNNENNNI